MLAFVFIIVGIVVVYDCGLFVFKNFHYYRL